MLTYIFLLLLGLLTLGILYKQLNKPAQPEKKEEVKKREPLPSVVIEEEKH